MCPLFLSLFPFDEEVFHSLLLKQVMLLLRAVKLFGAFVAVALAVVSGRRVQWTPTFLWSKKFWVWLARKEASCLQQFRSERRRRRRRSNRRTEGWPYYLGFLDLFCGCCRYRRVVAERYHQPVLIFH